jgi:lysophospholipase L1-like esterase
MGCGESEPTGESSGMVVSKILVVSDSMGTGYEIATPYPLRMAEILGIEVINNSINGRETGEAVGPLEGLLDQHSPSHLILLIGTNDARKNNQAEAITNLGLMSKMALQRKIVVVVGTIPVYPTSQEIDKQTGFISEGIRNLGGIQVADIRSALGDGNKTLGDQIHPNDIGQQLIAELFVKNL